MLIPDAQLEALADEFIALRLDLHAITLDQFINCPQLCRALALEKSAAERERRSIRVASGKADDPMKHHRYPRNASKSNFEKRKTRGLGV